MARPSIVPPNLNGHIYSCAQEVGFIGQKCQFSMYYQSNTPNLVAEVPNDENDIQGHWQTTIVPLLRAVLSVGTSVNDFRVWCMTWPAVATGIFSMGGVLGTFAGDPLPPQIALVLSKQTNLRGKSGRGRMYLCGMSEDGSTGGLPTAAQLLAAANLANVLKNTFIGAVTGRTFTPVVVSLKQYAIRSVVVVDPGPPPVVEPAPPPIICQGGPITNIVRDDIWNTQRSRTIGRGQ